MNEVAFVTENPIAVLTDEKKFSEFYQRIKAEVSGHVPDTTTAKGRGEIKSLAYKVTRTKTAIDDAGKKLNEDARKQIGVVDASRRRIRDELDALADEVRKPLTAWEDAEKERESRVSATLARMAELVRVTIEDGSNVIADRIGAVEAIQIDAATFLELTITVEAERANALASLNASLARAKQHEADQVELARLRQEREAREAEEAERHAREEAEAKAKKDAEEAKQRAEREAAARKEREERIAEEARQAEARKAQEAIDRAEREKAEAIARAEAEARAIREAAERVERERQAAIDAEKKEQVRRDADRTHRSKVMGEAKAAIMTCGADEETAKKIVLAIIAGEIPSVTLRF